jgi:hypothetical protein
MATIYCERFPTDIALAVIASTLPGKSSLNSWRSSVLQQTDSDKARLTVEGPGGSHHHEKIRSEMARPSEKKLALVEPFSRRYPDGLISDRKRKHGKLHADRKNHSQKTAPARSLRPPERLPDTR